MAILQSSNNQPAHTSAEANTRDMSALRQTIAGTGAIAGPLALLAGWIILLQPASLGLTFGWLISHAVLFGGVALLVPAVFGMRYLLHIREARNGDIAVGLAYLGALTLTGEYAIDLAVGQLASDRAELVALLNRITASAAISLVFYSLGPAALYIGLAMLVTGLYSSRRIPVWAAACAVVGVITVGVGRILDSGVVTLLGHVLMCIGFVPIGWMMLRGRAEPAKPM